MYQRISVFPPISFLSRNCHTICSPIVLGRLIFHIPHFGPWDVLILPLQMQTCFPSTTSQSKVADTRYQGTKPQLNSLQTSPGTDPRSGALAIHFIERTSFYKSKSIFISKATTMTRTSSPGERHFPQTLGEEPPPARSLDKGRWIHWAPTCDAPRLPTSSHLPHFFFRSFFFPL